MTSGRRDVALTPMEFGSMPASRGGLPALDTRLAFVHEGLSGFTMILREPGVHMVGHFQVHAVAQLAGYGPVQVLLHVAVSNRRPLREPTGAFHYLPLEVGWREDGVDDPQPAGVLGAQPLGEVVELFGFAAAYQPGEKPCPAVVSGEPDPGEGGGQYRPRYRVAQIAGQRQGQAGPGRGPSDGGDGRLGHAP